MGAAYGERPCNQTSNRFEIVRILSLSEWHVRAGRCGFAFESSPSLLYVLKRINVCVS